ncbi:hypothetical protein Ae717Ps2_7312c [Pseudonocardia sp. Ae717_Ps2]|uniref:hypothetical protein n=1 Tax=Pseudonocardia sp. Ae717_Ps2 TaxID=1885573 RepID=UPI00094B4034|nr:hypothetical protein [Pseudonocardia sp. Ae717_Ps2]OLM27536.1 hypothetical protein Ae717Ps2_7312c [Pseudonocardia sp. Ae717_Ps2]
MLEEFAGLLRLASTPPVEKGQPKMREQLLALYGRLVSEDTSGPAADGGHPGRGRDRRRGFERGQLGLRISFRLDDPEALVMLPTASPPAITSRSTSSPRPGRAGPGTRPAVGPGPRTAADGPLGGRRLRPLLDEIADGAARLHEVAA